MWINIKTKEVKTQPREFIYKHYLLVDKLHNLTKRYVLTTDLKYDKDDKYILYSGIDLRDGSHVHSGFMFHPHGYPKFYEIKDYNYILAKLPAHLRLKF